MLHVLLPCPLFLKTIASQSCPNNSYEHNSRTMCCGSSWYMNKVSYRIFLSTFCAHRYILYNVVCAKMQYRELQQTMLPTTKKIHRQLSLTIFKHENFQNSCSSKNGLHKKMVFVNLAQRNSIKSEMKLTALSHRNCPHHKQRLQRGIWHVIAKTGTQHSQNVLLKLSSNTVQTGRALTEDIPCN